MPAMAPHRHVLGLVLLPAVVLGLTAPQRYAVYKAPLILAQRRRLLPTTGPLASAAAAAVEGPTPNPLVEAPAGGSGSAATTFNIIKNIVGAGMLSLPAGVAAFSDRAGALTPATLLVVAFGIVSAYTFSLLGKVTHFTKAESYEDAWAKAIHPRSAWVVNAACTLTCLFSCLAYSLIIGDALQPLFYAMNLPEPLLTRQGVIISLSTLVLLPLCLLKDLSALAFTSILGVAGTIFATLSIMFRASDGTYAAGGKFLSSALAMQPQFGAAGGSFFSAKSFVLLSMLGTAFNAHFNAPRFFLQLKGRSQKTFDKVVWRSFWVSTAIYAAVMVAGFLTFGGNCLGLILSNYSNTDGLLNICRTAIGASILFTFPLTFVGARDGILAAICGGKKPQESQRIGTTLAILAGVTALACKISDVGVVVSFGGAVLGSAIIYIFPGLLHLATQRKQIRSGELNLGTSRWGRFSLLGNYALVGMGAAMGIIGGVVSILSARGML